jgi:hypothetical protein
MNNRQHDIFEIKNTITKMIAEFNEKHKDEPYLLENIFVIKRKYNPNYDNDKTCICGHPYHRHFDSYENMEAVGCKYCGCNNFEEITEEELREFETMENEFYCDYNCDDCDYQYDDCIKGML